MEPNIFPVYVQFKILNTLRARELHQFGVIHLFIWRVARSSAQAP